MCEEQTSGALGHLQADPDWRKEYLELWMHQRPPPFRITFDDYDFDGALTLACCCCQGTTLRYALLCSAVQQCSACSAVAFGSSAGA